MTYRLRFLIPLLCLFVLSDSSRAETPAPAKTKQFIYVLRLVPRLHDDKNWTKEDEAVLGRHLTRFKEAIKTGQLILAGRTLDPGDKTFGIAIFEGELDLKEYKDEYKEGLRQIIDAKIAGEEIVAPEVQESPKVVDLMEALRRSLDSVSTTKKKPAKADLSAVRKTKAKGSKAVPARKVAAG
jgi:uncharacterized protein YciI